MIPPSRSRRLRATLGAMLLALTMSATAVVSVEPAEAATTISLWGSKNPKGVKLVRNSRAMEVGNKFTPSANGTVTGVRFYKVKGMKGSHTGTLWSASGKKLASVKFTKESRSGWQKATFSKPVKVAKGATYTVSLHIPKGGKFARTTKAPAASKSTILKLSSRNKSGVYLYKSKVAFPKKSSGAQYWVDVSFAKAAAVAPAPAPAPSVDGFPTKSGTGVPAGWSPSKTINGDHTVTTEGATLSNVRIVGGTLYIRAKNVKVRNVELVDSRVVNFRNSVCYNGLLLENVSIIRKSVSDAAWMPAIEAGGYTARKVKIDGWWEGFRVGGASFNTPCGPVVIDQSWVNIEAPQECRESGSADWHGDSVQAYDGSDLTVRNSYLRLAGMPPSCGGNAVIFYPDQQNTRVSVENVLLDGGGFALRLSRPGAVRGMKVIDGSWEYNSPVYVTTCGSVTWGSGNEVVRVNSSGGLTPVRAIKCGA